MIKRERKKMGLCREEKEIRNKDRERELERERERKKLLERGRKED